jgi:putative peptidoglycan lipid II flippase
VLVTIFGTSGQLDPLLAAFRLPDIVYGLVAAGSFSTVLVPALSSLHARGETARARVLLGSFATIAVALLLILVVVALLLSDAFSHLLLAGLSNASRAEARDLSRILLASTSLLALSAIGAAAAAAADRFAATAVNGILYNIGTIVGAIVGGVGAGGFGAAIGTACGALLVFVVSMRALWSSPFRPAWPNFHDAQTAQLFRALAPRVGSALAVQLLLATFVGIAANLGPGNITIWSYAFTLLQLPIAMVPSALATAILPAASRLVARADMAGLAALGRRSLGSVGLALAPIAAIGGVLASHAVGLVTGLGSSTADIQRTGTLLALLLIGLGGYGATSILVRIFYSVEDTLNPTLSALLDVVIDIALAALLVPILGLAALGVALSVGAWIEALFLSWRVRTKLPSLAPRPVVALLLPALLLSLPAAFCSWLVSTLCDALLELRGPLGDFVVIAVAGSCGVLVYAALALVARRPEAAPLAALIVRVAPASRRIPGLVALATAGDA